MAMKERLSVNVDGEELTEAMVLIRTRASDLESVRKLNCWACNIGDVSVVRRMPNLEVCSLTINKITSLQDFAHCYNLQELYVRTNNIQQLGDIHYLKNLRKLRSLWLSENPCATEDNYRMTVLKTLPHLQKLDNIAVSENEVARAQEEGDDLPLPNDFSFSAVLKESSSRCEEYRDGTKRDSVSESSEKWARPRQKRQQKKREDYLQEKKGAQGGNSEAKSGDDSGDSSTRSSGDGGSCSVRSSSDSGDSEDCCKLRTDGSMNLSRCDAEFGQLQEEAEDDRSKEIDNAATCEDVETQDSNDSGTQVSWAIKVEVQSKVAGSDAKENNYKHGSHLIDKMLDVCEIVDDSNKGNHDQMNDGDTDVSKCDTTVQASSVISTFCDQNSVVGRCYDKSDWSCNNNLSSEFGRGSNVIPAATIESINIWSITAADFNNMVNNSNIDNISSAAEIKDSLHFDNQLHSSIATNNKVTGQAETPLLDKTRLEDSFDILDQVEDHIHQRETQELKRSADLTQELNTLEKLKVSRYPLIPTTRTEVVKTESETYTQFDSGEPVNGNKNSLEIQPEDRPELSTSELDNTEEIKTGSSSIVNSNILQAVLCLIQELDKDSLDIVVSAVKGRLDDM